MIKGKILMHQLWTNCDKLEWDDKILNEMHIKWAQFYKEMSQLSDVVIYRCMKPSNAKGSPVLVVFSDASMDAYGTVCYVRWEIDNGKYKSFLLASKSRIAPITIVRLELLAAVLSNRLRNSIENECRFQFEPVIHIVDSEIVGAMIQRESYGLNTFTSTRIGEIQGSSKPGEWFWVNKAHNIADVLTRGEVPSKIGINSKWQNGPKFLNLPINDWPIWQDCLINDLPETIEKTFKIDVKVEKELICLERFSAYHKLLRVTARILSLKLKPNTLKRITNPITINGIKDAMQYWILESQCLILNDLVQGGKGYGKFRKLRQFLDKHGIYVVGGRAVRWFQASYNKRLIPILPKDKFAQLYVEMVHNKKTLWYR